jgi:uncharacterized protein YndB with AHSA1/START domain
MQTERSAVEEVPDVVLVKKLTVPLSPAACFRLFSESSALESWLCRSAKVEGRVGGAYELFWAPDDPENDSTIGCRITAFEVGRLLAFQWRSPRQFKSFANAADPLTHVVVAFHGDAVGTEILLLHSGWRSTPDWLAAAEWQSTAWDFAFRSLNEQVTRMLAEAGARTQQ